MGRLTPRAVALEALSACERQGAWSDGYLKNAIRSAGLDGRDAALATRICYGVLQNRMLCDFWIARFSSVPLKKLEEKVVQCLRVGMYQMAFLDKVPHSAAVDESVKLARAYSKNPRSPGLVNGILRSFSRQVDQLPQPEGDELERLSIRYSHPKWLVEELDRALEGKGLEALLQAHNGEPELQGQVNPLKAAPEQVREELERQGVTAQPHPWLPGCLLLSGTGDLEQLPAFREGRLTIQDPAAKLAVLAAELRPGMRVLDACAAPGGKTFAMAMAMEDRGEVISCDIHPHKLKLIEDGAARLGIHIVKTGVADGKCYQEAWEDGFDLVLADVPCSGLGVIRKKPDIRYKDPKPLAGLPTVQRAILDNVSRYVKPGGTLVYATCTVLRRENEAVVEEFLREHPGFEDMAFSLPGPAGRVDSGRITLWPHIHGTDGFFIAKLRRKA